MAIFLAGKILKGIREQKNLTQEKLCVGICDISTLSKIENGMRMPSYFIFDCLMKRLGCDSSKYYLHVTEKAEMDFMTIYNDIDGLIIDYQYEEAAILLDELEKSGLYKAKTQIRDNNSVDNIKLQMVLCLKAAIYKKDNEERLKTLRQAISLTIPNFDENETSQYLLTYNEISLINMLANTYAKMDKTQETISILYKIKQSMDMYYSEEYEKSKGYSLTLYNLSKYLGLAKRYREALEICDIGILCCKRNKRLRLLPHITYNKAYILYHMGGDEKYKELLTQAYYALILYGFDKVAEQVKFSAKTKMQFDII